MKGISFGDVYDGAGLARNIAGRPEPAGKIGGVSLDSAGLAWRVVVKVAEDDAFVLTAYLTDKVKKGVQLWPRRE